MAYVSVPKDLSRVKNKLMFGLTRRQLICFSIAGAIGIPVYIFTRGTIGNSASALLMIAVMLPLFFFAMYEKDGQPAEVILKNYLRVAIFWPRKRPYVTENMYESLVKEAKIIAEEGKRTTQEVVGKRAASKGKPR